MAFDCEGTIYIPLEEFWGWANKILTKVEDIADLENPPHINPQKQVMKFFYRDSGYLAEEIDLATFWELVHDFVPFQDAEYEFGFPNFEDIDIVITFAASTYCHPADWNVKSNAAKEWEKFRTIEERNKT